jgi:hypothetical protein
MNKIFKNLFIVVLLAVLMVAVTNCTKSDSDSIEATKIAMGVQATLTAESAMNATVDARVQDTQTAMAVTETPTTIPTVVTEIPTTTPTTVTEIPTTTPTTVTETPTITPTVPSGPVAILDPTDKAVVPMIIEVSGFVDKSALQGLFLNVIITTQTKQYWVQNIPDIQDDGYWSAAPVYLGDTDHGAGEEFRICAVLTGSQLRVGQIPSYPEGTKMCITVIREK